ncbi:adenylate/guanylate cyclase domain-containing protein [Aestuariispira insulae]|uniref:Adenylate cyclase n=1 Tax=Aestuariispira insulae TaxID=1461337 RepID=A0A3D9HWM2_9PROT|nr:adenylate/guanylate cyclase domain-containing protein [Aestuariispira insulae]RED53904.1 adenylate cyclase [Aestuariispira insulae]
MVTDWDFKQLTNRRFWHLSAGLVMFFYVTCHLINHAAGVVSVDSANLAEEYLIELWTTIGGILLLSAAVLFHLGSALWVTFIRRSLRMPLWQWSQLLLGLLIPALLIEHAMATAGVRLQYGMDPDYRYVLAIFFHFAPEKLIGQLSLLVVAWGHGCIGLHHWLKIRDWYPRIQAHLYALCLIIPTAAIAGVISAGFEVRALVQDPIWSFDMLQEIAYPGGEADLFVARMRDYWLWGYALLILLVFAGRYMRIALYTRRKGVRVTYPSGRRVLVPPGATLLETSRAGGIPHASVCGGRGRCSTCRVLILAGADQALAPPDPLEEKVLANLNMPENVRLACRVRPTGDLRCEPLLPADVTARDALSGGRYRLGQELDIAVMFADLRGFTKLSESKLPFDVVFLLNQYFRFMGTAIEDAGGRVDKFIGDGIMALFGIDGDPMAGKRSALIAARQMAAQLEILNERLKNELGQPLKLVMGVHSGPAIVGTMGHGQATQVTAIGDTVNTAARLESLAKEHDVQLMVSDRVGRDVGIDLGIFPAVEMAVRGRKEPLQVHPIRSAGELPEL